MSENYFKLPSFAKINWFLRVLGKRADGFHELCTVFQTISLHDNLTFTENENLILTCDKSFVPIGEKNLIIKAGMLIREKFGVKKGAKIYLEKKIPSPGGLGGGSSNAAIAVLGLLKLWQLEIEFDEILPIAGELGSDVPFFLYGGTALGTGRGTRILPLEENSEKYLLIVTPPVNVSTAEAFSRLNAPHLTNETSKSNLQICLNEARTLNLRQSELKNDFETSVFQAAPEIKSVKEKLLESGAIQALLSGSGASVFAIFDKEETRQTAQKAIETENNWRRFVVAAISREKYREALKPCISLLPISF
jgi:4-diphosphocytidyl-2-C-methyl-D-erythritol kinase